MAELFTHRNGPTAALFSWRRLAWKKYAENICTRARRRTRRYGKHTGRTCNSWRRNAPPLVAEQAALRYSTRESLPIAAGARARHIIASSAGSSTLKSLFSAKHRRNGRRQPGHTQGVSRPPTEVSACTIAAVRPAHASRTTNDAHASGQGAKSHLGPGKPLTTIPTTCVDERVHSRKAVTSQVRVVSAATASD